LIFTQVGPFEFSVMQFLTSSPHVYLLFCDAGFMICQMLSTIISSLGRGGFVFWHDGEDRMAKSAMYKDPSNT
jgi:hypothetical protein